MPRFRQIVAAAVTAAFAAVTLPLAAAPAGAATSASTTVLLVHGFDGGSPFEGDAPLDSSVNCGDATQRAWAAGLRARGHTDVRTVGFYVGDHGCHSYVEGRGDNTVWTSIDEIARELAWLIHDGYTRHGRNVALSAHSMGGVVVRAALSGVETRRAGYPPALQVSDVVTSGSPHGGTGIGALCGVTFGAAPTQCTELAPLSPFLTSLAHNPQGGVGSTDWTLIGSDCDSVVSTASATSMSQASWSRPALAKVRFAAPGFPLYCFADTGYDHGELVKLAAPLDAISRAIRTTA